MDPKKEMENELNQDKNPEQSADHEDAVQTKKTVDKSAAKNTITREKSVETVVNKQVVSSKKVSQSVKPDTEIKSSKPVKPLAKNDVMIAAANQLLDRFEAAFVKAKIQDKKQKDQQSTNMVIYYIFKRIDNLIDAQGKLGDKATPDEIDREQQYKTRLKEIFTKALKDVAKLTLKEAYNIYRGVKEEKKLAKAQQSSFF